MHVHILGICGTFMGSLALLARELGHRVSGSDANVYPPMSTQLEAAGITLQDGYSAANLSLASGSGDHRQRAVSWQCRRWKPCSPGSPALHLRPPVARRACAARTAGDCR